MEIFFFLLKYITRVLNGEWMAVPKEESSREGR